MFILGGYIFDKRARYSFTVWTSAGAASIVVAGNIGWQFNKALTLTGGYTGVPGSRSLVNTFPFFTATDRSMADNFFRPGFTQGVWASGEPVKGLNYLAFLGNGLNTLNISANKIDTHLLVSGSVWWEPLGPYGEPGKSRNMYDDYFASKKVRIRIGTAFTRSREDRFSNLDQSSPDNTSLYNSDGVLTFSTGAFAPGVTLDLATYKMWAARRRHQMERACGQRAILHALAKRFRSRRTASARIHIRPWRRALGELFCQAEKVDAIYPRIVGASGSSAILMSMALG